MNISDYNNKSHTLPGSGTVLTIATLPARAK